MHTWTLRHKNLYKYVTTLTWTHTHIQRHTYRQIHTSTHMFIQITDTSAQSQTHTTDIHTHLRETIDEILGFCYRKHKALGIIRENGIRRADK